MKTLNGFDIKYVFLAYVPPFRDGDQPFKIQTEVLKKENGSTPYLFKIFDKAIDEAHVEIIFTSDEKQNNDVRKDILSIAQKAVISEKSTHAKNIAHHSFWYL